MPALRILAAQIERTLSHAGDQAIGERRRARIATAVGNSFDIATVELQPSLDASFFPGHSSASGDDGGGGTIGAGETGSGLGSSDTFGDGSTGSGGTGGRDTHSDKTGCGETRGDGSGVTAKRGESTGGAFHFVRRWAVNTGPRYFARRSASNDLLSLEVEGLGIS